MLKKLYFFAILSITLFSNKQLFAQTNSAPDGIIFQAVATDPQGNPAAGRTIYIKDAVLQSTVNGQTVFSETFKVTASITGVFTIVIGKGQKISGPNSINNLDWSVGPYFLNIKAAVAPSLPLSDWNVDQQYIDMGTSQFWSVPFALYASNVAGFDLKLNISDTTNMLKQYLRKSDTASLSNRINISNTAVAQEATRAIAAEALKANATDVATGLGLKENISNKSTTTTLGTSDILYPTQNAVMTYVDAQITSATIVDANTTTKGKLQLAGDLGGTSSLPTVLTVGGSTASNINAATTLANAASNTNTASTIVKRDASGNFSAGTIAANVTGNVTGNATNVSGTVAVANGGTGATTLTGYIKGNGSNAFTTVSTIPSTDITGLVTKVNGTSPGADGNVSIVFGHVTSGILSSKPADGTGANGDIYVVSGDGILSNNGRTYIYNGTTWNETNTNQATTDARYLQLAGGTLSGNLIMPTNNIITLTDLPSSGTDAANKNYVDTKVSSVTIADATVSVKGKLQLAGDLGGTATAPTVPGLVLKEDIVNKSTTTALGTSDVLYPTQNAVKTYVDATVSSATPNADATTKGKLQLAGDLGGTSSLPTVLTVGGSTASSINAATTLANAASNTNTASTIVKRDASGNFSAGTITANITGNVTGDVTGKATNVSGTVAVANGGTGATTLTGYIKGNGSNAFTTVSTIPSTDITGLVTKVNGTLPGADGNVSIVFGHVTSGILSSKPADGTGTNGDIYVVSGDGILSNNGRTYIYNGTTWNEINTNQATTDARYLQLAGGTLSGNLIIPINNKITLTDLPSSGTDAANKNYIDTKVSAASIADATVSIKGKLQLAGDLGGTGTTASAPVISDNAITTVKILDANITDAKIATLSGSKVTGDISGNAANVSGTVAIANGGTGATTKAAAFDALSPMTTSGDILYGGVSGTGTRLAKGTDGQILTLASGLPSWASNSGVPYTGATRAVDLGSYNLTVNGITLGSNGTSMIGASYSSIIFGKGATVGIGFSAAGESNAIGYNASAKGPQSIAIGSNASANQTQGLSIGYHSSIGTGYGLAIGSYTQSNGMYSVALGDFATTSANYSTAIGYQSAASGLNSVAIGENASTNIANQILLGNTDITNVKTSGTYTAGTVTYPNAHGTGGQILSTTGSGALSWITPSTTATAYSGTLPVANGGTGSSTQNFVDLTTGQTIAGGKTFSADLNVNGITVGRGKFNENSNTAFGLAALSSNASYANTGIGNGALAANVSGNANTALGYIALSNNTSGVNNVSIGAAALQTNISGSQNTAIGNSADVASAALSNATAIGNDAIVAASNTIQLGNTSITNVKTSGTITAGAVTYPNAHGTSGQILSTTGSGALSWITPSTTATAYSGTLPVANGGTGASTKATAFDALSPLTTSGDILYGGVSGTGTRLAKGTDGQILTLASGLPTWASNSGVPYTGATGAVDLGAYNLTVNGITLGSNGTANMGASFSSIIIGKGATVGIGNIAASESNAIGYNASATGPQSIAIGSNASANQTQGLSIGYHSSIGSGYGLAIGSYTQSNGMYSVALGDFATTSANYSTAIGYQSAASGLNSVAIGENASTNIANQILLGNTDITNVKTSGTYTAGTVTYPNAHGSSGQVLSTTGSGALSWITPSTTATAFSGTVPVANGGTGATTLTGLVKGNGTSALTAAVAGTDFLAPNGSAGSLTNFPTLNQNTTGTAANVTGTVAVVNGGTGAISATAALTNLGAAPIASPTFTGIPLAPTATAGTNTTQLATTSFVTTALSVAVREVADEFTATAAQSNFTLTQTKSANSKVKMYINGIRISNTAYSVSGTTLTYTPANNGAYALSASDRVQFDYYY